MNNVQKNCTFLKGGLPLCQRICYAQIKSQIMHPGDFFWCVLTSCEKKVFWQCGHFFLYLWCSMGGLRDAASHGWIVGTGISILRYINISILIKCSNLSRFYKKKKWAHFIQKLRCDNFGNWSISTKNALNNQIQSSIKIYIYIVWNCCLPIADFESFTLKKWWISWKSALPLFVKNWILHTRKKLKPQNELW